MSMTLAGKRTILTCCVIIVLAAIQKFMGVKVPDEIWLALFAAAIIFLRSGFPPAASVLALLGCGACLLAGCQSPNVYIGDSAIAAAHGSAASCGATNSLSGASSATNSWTMSSSSAARGGIIVQVTVQKNVSPTTTTTGTIPLQ